MDQDYDYTKGLFILQFRQLMSSLIKEDAYKAGINVTPDEFINNADHDEYAIKTWKHIEYMTKLIDKNNPNTNA